MNQPIDYTAPGCNCAAGGMGRRSDCPVHGVTATREITLTDWQEEVIRDKGIVERQSLIFGDIDTAVTVYTPPAATLLAPVGTVLVNWLDTNVNEWERYDTLDAAVAAYETSVRTTYPFRDSDTGAPTWTTTDVEGVPTSEDECDLLLRLQSIHLESSVQLDTFHVESTTRQDWDETRGEVLDAEGLGVKKGQDLRVSLIDQYDNVLDTYDTTAE